MRSTILLSLVLTGLAFGQADDLKYKDKIYPAEGKKGDVKTVEIVDETFDKVKINLGHGAISEIPNDEIGRIDYDPNSGGVDLKNAQRSLQGPPEESIKAFKEVLVRAQSRKLYEQHALYGLGQAYQNAGDFKNASAQFSDLISKYPETKYLFFAMENAVACFLAANDFPGAKTCLGKFTTAPQNDGGRFQAMKAYLGAWIAEMMNDGAGALQGYTTAAGCRFPEISNKAKAGRGRCLVATGDYTNAEKMFREVIDGGGKGMQLGAAWNGMGDISFDKARKEQNPANKATLFHAALMCYLRAAILYEPQEGESPEEKAKGMAKAAYCFAQLADSQTDAAIKADYRGRAAGLRGEAMQIGGRWGNWASQNVK